MRSAEDLAEEVTVLRQSNREYYDKVEKLTSQLEQKEELLAQSAIVITALVQRIQLLENSK